MINPYDPELWPIERPAPPLYQETARALVGRDIPVRLRELNIFTLGAYRRVLDASGQEIEVIDIMPGLDENKMLGTFLEECAHAILHWDRVELEDDTQPPVTLETAPWLRNLSPEIWSELQAEYEARPAEIEAKQLAGKIIAAVEQALGRLAAVRTKLLWLRDYFDWEVVNA